MEHDRAVGRARQQGLVEPVRREQLAARRRLGLVVAHAHPDVGVERVRALGRSGGVARGAGAVRGVALVRPQLGRRRDDDLHPRQGAEQHQRVRHVVAVADVDEPHPVEPAEPLAQRQQVGERLARVVLRREHVDHRHARVRGELLDHRVRSGANADGVNEARQYERGVAPGLAAGDLRLALAQQRGMPAELVHAHLEREPCARRRLVEDQRDAAPRQRARGEPVALQLQRAVEQPLELIARKLLAGEEVTRHPGIVVRVVTWNLFHGRASPPSPKRSLLSDFVELLDSLDWHVALLQEAPPRWRDALARELRAQSAITLTSRNFGAPIRGWIAERRPNAIKSNEGGSNQLLVRDPFRIDETRELTIALLPERRRMLWALLSGPASLAVANVHGSVDGVRGASGQILHAAAQAVEWSGELPLLFGGDLNLRPARQPDVFEQLAERFGLAPPTAPDSIDHLLARGLDVVEPPRRGPALRLSDHAYVTAAVGI